MYVCLFPPAPSPSPSLLAIPDVLLLGNKRQPFTGKLAEITQLSGKASEERDAPHTPSSVVMSQLGHSVFSPLSPWPCFSGGLHTAHVAVGAVHCRLLGPTVCRSSTTHRPFPLLEAPKVTCSFHTLSILQFQFLKISETLRCLSK